MPATKKKPARKAEVPLPPDSRQSESRLWLTFPAPLIKRPVIWELGQKFKVVFNLRQVSVGKDIGIVCLELDGARTEIKNAINWLESLGIKVEPVEISVLES
ncbi:MAG: ferredoxin [Pedosphaera sp. Tous-C6FEB]|nr:MAG: ferredoxin [Pedosphaera sp. Tous-C6FEB]